ncbi:MAG: hypothetical protein ACRDMH_11925 [Solirubrobacterales bacterium]
MRERKLKPSPALIISLVALVLAATGTATALHGRGSTAGPVKGKSAVGFCNPNSAAFTECVTLRMKLPHPGRVLLVANGSWRGDADAANGQCHVVVAGGQVGLAPNPGQNLGTHADGAHEGSFAITGVTDVLPAGRRTFRLTCSEATPDFAVDSADLSAVLLN